MSDIHKLLGKLIDRDAYERGEIQRDCIHIAVVPLIAGDDRLSRGREFQLAYGTTNIALAADADYGHPIHGIVDPFLRISQNRWRIDEGEIFWGFLLPGTVTGMRHHWHHPAFDELPTAGPAETWLRSFAQRWNFDYNEMISTGLQGEDNICAMGRDLHGAGELGDDLELFWKHLSDLVDRQFDDAHKESVGWTCSC